jgi:alpha-tubulin suppressor-like RCC1 family protein
MPNRIRHALRGTLLFVPALFAAVTGCREVGTSPTDPESTPALASAAATTTWLQVSAGGVHTCGVRSDFTAWCWGANGLGRLGDGSNEMRFTPVRVAGGLSFRQVSAGPEQTCGITTDSRAYCWGRNHRGQLGDGTTTDRQTPVAVAGGHRFLQISPGYGHTCAIKPNKVAFCWGEAGLLGNGTQTRSLTPTRVAGGHLFTLIEAGSHHTCGLDTDQHIWCWGANFDAQLGDGTTTDRLRPVLVRGNRTWQHVGAGGTHTCAVATTKAAYCWGTNRDGQVGNGESGFGRRQIIPHEVQGGIRFETITAGETHTCGLRGDNRAFCWGDNNFGQVGDGTQLNNRLAPVAVVGGRFFSMVTGGGTHTCAVALGGRAFCWGQNNVGQLGKGTEGNSSRPVAVVDPS